MLLYLNFNSNRGSYITKVPLLPLFFFSSLLFYHCPASFAESEAGHVSGYCAETQASLSATVGSPSLLNKSTIRKTKATGIKFATPQKADK